EYVKSEPILFSSFYAVPTPQLKVDLPILAVFYTEMINKVPAALKQILDQTKWTPCELFGKWNEWRNTDYQDHIIDEAFILNLFGVFIKHLLLSASVGSESFQKCPKEVA